MEGGTLFQLWNLNRRNISSDISGKFNAAINFFELVLTPYVLAAAMHYFGISTLDGTLSRNVISIFDRKNGWVTLKLAAGRIVDRYVMVNELSTNTMTDSDPVEVSWIAIHMPKE